MTIRGWTWLAALALSGCFAPVDVGGNDAGNACGPSTCAGCCDPAGVCQTASAQTCGGGGAACFACGLVESCDIASPLNWSAVSRGDLAVQTLNLANSGSTPIVATVGVVSSTSGDDKAFTRSVPAGMTSIPANSTKSIEFTFAPTEIKSYLARLTVRLSASCPDKVIVLSGTGVDSVLTWAPNPLDFGYVTPGVERTLYFTLTNPGSKPILVSNIRASTAEYRIVSPQPITVPANGTAKVAITFKPTILGPRNARVDFDTDLFKQPTGIAQLRGYGGGPDIDAAAIDFGNVAYFASSSSFVGRTLTIQNVGTQPTPPDPKANLHLGANGTGNVYWDVRVKPGVAGNTAQASELCVGTTSGGVCSGLPIAGSYDPALGIKASLDVPIRATPSTLGLKVWELVLYSNDPDEPQFALEIRAKAVVLPPCDFEVSPLSLSFGLVPSAAIRDLEVRITNKGQNAADVCLFSGLALKSGTHPAFSLLGGPISSLTLLPQESKALVIRLAPTGAPPAGPTPITGALELYSSNPAKPQLSIPLNGTLGPSCLTIVPGRADFGAVQTSCGSATRTFSIYNVCSSPVTVNNAALAQLGSEFVTVSTAGVAPSTVLYPGTSPATFSLKYSPTNAGADASAFVINLSQAGLPVDYVIPLTGSSNSNGLNIDSVVFGSNAQADVLLVIDNSCSMNDKQQALSAVFSSLSNYATANAIDYQLAVTTSDMMFEAGRITGSATVPKILTPTTPNLQSLFATKVKLGINGSPSEQLLATAVAAVTPPLVYLDNAGLVRPGATLGIVSISDSDDQSPQTVSFYVNQLLSVKPPGQVTYSAMAPLQQVAPVGCAYDGTGGAPRTVSAAQSLNGLTREICTTSWAQAMSDLAPIAFGAAFMNTSLLLNAMPDLTAGRTITVKIDGLPIDPVTPGGLTVWSYDSTGNRVVFEPNYAPQPGSTVSATYVIACLP